MNKVELHTYKKDYSGNVIPGESEAYAFDIYWLEEQIAPQTVNEFLSEYTYDDTEYLLEKLMKLYEERIREAMENRFEPDLGLEVTYLDAVDSAGEVPEWVLNVEYTIIEDGLTEEQAEKLFYLIDRSFTITF